MSNSDNHLYYYEDNISLVVTTDQFYVDNRPMDTRNLKIHKGVTNEFVFTVRNRDRKLQNIAADTVIAYLIDPYSSTRLLQRTLTDTTDVGKLKLVIQPGDIANLEKGLYKMFVTRSDIAAVDRPLYTDQNNNMSFNVEVTDQTVSYPVPTQTQNTFIQTSSTQLGDSSNIYVTNALYGNLDRNFPDALHTIAMKLDGYTGNITVQASCLDGTPATEDQSTDWFDVSTDTVTDNTKTFYLTNFTVNCNWVRVVHSPLTGNITEVSLRN